MAQRTRLLHLMSQQLVTLAQSTGAAVVLTNQMTTKACVVLFVIMSPSRFGPRLKAQLISVKTTLHPSRLVKAF